MSRKFCLHSHSVSVKVIKILPLDDSWVMTPVPRVQGNTRMQNKLAFWTLILASMLSSCEEKIASLTETHWKQLSPPYTLQGTTSMSAAIDNMFPWKQDSSQKNLSLCFPILSLKESMLSCSKLFPLLWKNCDVDERGKILERKLVEDKQ